MGASYEEVHRATKSSTPARATVLRLSCVAGQNEGRLVFSAAAEFVIQELLDR